MKKSTTHFSVKQGQFDVTQDLAPLLLENAKEIRGKKRIACAVALNIAADMKVSPKKVSRVCRDNGIKIRSCMLDCFE